jgi:hypothetical protein
MKRVTTTVVFAALSAAMISACGSSGPSTKSLIPPLPPGAKVLATASTTTGSDSSQTRGKASGSIPAIPAVAAACAQLSPYNHVLAGGSARIAGLKAALPAVISQLTGFVSRPAPRQSLLRSEQLRAKSVLIQLQVVSSAVGAYPSNPSKSARSRLQGALDLEAQTARAETLPECALASN